MPHVHRTLAVLLVAVLAGVAWSPPAATAAGRADDCYVAANHRIFLDRDATAAELDEWAAAFAAGTPRHALPAALAGSDEWLSVVVTRIYRLALERDPEPEGEQYWIEQLRAGSKVTRIAAMVFGSDEFYGLVDNDDEAMVVAFYDLILGRSPRDERSGPAADARFRSVSPADIAYWVGEVTVRGRGGVAAAIHASAESRGRRVGSLYRQILDRSAEPEGRAYWTARLATMNDVRLAVHLAASAELRTRTARGCTLTGEVAFTDLTPTTGADDLAASADGRYVAFTSQAAVLPGEPEDFVSDVYLLDTDTGAITNLTPDGDAPSAQPSISADGTRVVFASRASNLTDDADDGASDVFLYDVPTGTTTNLTATFNRAATKPDISADGSTVAHLEDVVAFQRRVIVTDLASGARTNATSATTSDVGYLSLSGDGTVVAFSTYGNELTADPDDAVEDVFVHDLTTGVITNVTAAGDDNSTDPELSADGRRLAFRSYAGNLDGPNRHDVASLFVADLATGTVVGLTRGINRSVAEGLSLSADGTVVAFSSRATNLTGEPDNDDADDVFVTATSGPPATNLTSTTFLAHEPEDDGSTSPVLVDDGSSVIFLTTDPDLTGSPDQRRTLVLARLV